MKNMETMNVYMPTRLVTGKECVKKAHKELAALGDVCLILTGKTAAKKCGALADVETALQNGGVTYAVWDGIGQNPTFDQCDAAAKEAIAIGAKFIIGIGGGSPMDAAKAVAVLAANEGMTQKELYAMNWPNQPLLIVGVGTTAGTGSEVTKIAVITTQEGRKTALRDDSMFATYAFGDPLYTMTLPSEFTRSTAVDALAHCVESYFANNANEISKTYAVRGIRLLKQVFQRVPVDAYGELSYEDRETLYHASIYGGLAINVTGTAMAHTLGYILTEQHGIPHGAACAIFLPAFYEHNKKAVPELTKLFLEEIGCTQESFLQMIENVTPKYPLHITLEELEREQQRWVKNASLEKVWGGVALDEVFSVMLSVSTED